jgi:carboxylate-amine ligase
MYPFDWRNPSLITTRPGNTNGLSSSVSQGICPMSSISAPPDGITQHAHEWTVAVEQEFLVVDRWSREPVPFDTAGAGSVGARSDTVDDLDPGSGLAPGEPAGTTAGGDEPIALHVQLTKARQRLAEAARAKDCRLVAVGTPPLSATTPRPGPGDQRGSGQPSTIADGDAVCGCNIHIGPSDLDTAIVVSNRMRRWLPVLLALSANSPIRHATYTGYASWRYLMRSRSPVSGPPPFFDSATEYRQLVAAIVADPRLAAPRVAHGATSDEDILQWDLMPSTRLPTIELRIADIPITVDEVELLADLTMALAITSVADANRGTPPPRPSDALVRAACLRAARDGVRGHGISTETGELVPAWNLVHQLVEYVRPALTEAGRDTIVDNRLDWLRVNGGGADRQRRFFSVTRNPRRLIDFLVQHTEPG